MRHDTVETLERAIADRSISVAVVGLGYVGLPLLGAFHRAGIEVIGLDIDASKVAALHEGRSYIDTFPSERVAELAASSRFRATTDFSALSEADAILICVPTPLTPTREPDLSYIQAAADALRSEGYDVRDEDMLHLSPARFDR